MIAEMHFFQALICALERARQFEPGAHSMCCIFPIKSNPIKSLESRNYELFKQIAISIRVIFYLQMFRKTI